MNTALVEPSALIQKLILIPKERTFAATLMLVVLSNEKIQSFSILLAGVKCVWYDTFHRNDSTIVDNEEYLHYAYLLLHYMSMMRNDVFDVKDEDKFLKNFQKFIAFAKEINE